ncbi:MAG: c-type cytochrome [bacterium]|nr:c-type cytochrome [bacterium]
MKTRLGLAIIATMGMTFFLSAPLVGAQPPVRPLKAKIQNGAMLFDTKGCSSCHTVKGRGGDAGPDLTRMVKWASPLLGAAAMWNHVPLMSKMQIKHKYAWPDFENEDIGDIFTYLNSLNCCGGDVFAFRGEAASGRATFVGAGCVKCHGEPFAGGLIGPDLGDKAAAIQTEGAFATRMLRHAPKMLPVAKRERIPWPELTGSEMAHIFAYLKHLKKE